jgi:hypothetical protein
LEYQPHYCLEVVDANSIQPRWFGFIAPIPTRSSGTPKFSPQKAAINPLSQRNQNKPSHILSTNLATMMAIRIAAVLSSRIKAWRWRSPSFDEVLVVLVGIVLLPGSRPDIGRIGALKQTLIGQKAMSDETGNM